MYSVDMLEIKIKYFADFSEEEKVQKISVGDWIDLRAATDIFLDKDVFKMIPLGVGMILPEGYEAHIVPRSSTFKKYGILQTNHMGVIDNVYSGDEDEWKMPVYGTKPSTIAKGTRICQFRIVEKMPEVTFTEVEHLNEVSRGGFGSTGEK